MAAAYGGNGFTLLRRFLLLAVLYACCHGQEEKSTGCSASEGEKTEVQCNSITDFSAVTDSLTSHQKVYQLAIEGSPLVVLKRADFDNPVFKELEDLYLISNNITIFNPEILQGLSALYSLILRGNNLTSLNADAFSSLGSLTYLRLSDNQITDIHPTAFKSLHNLTYLDLSGNRLTSIVSNYFQGLNNLNELHLADNIITSIEEGSLNGLDKLEFIRLGGNKIKSIDSMAFQTLTKLRMLILGNNELESFDSLLLKKGSVYVLDLSYNRLEDLENFPLNSSTLQGLLLSNGGIQTIPVNYFENVPNLVFLALSNKNISELDANLLATLTKCKFLDLKNNSLVSLNVNSFQQLHRILNQPGPVTLGSGRNQETLDINFVDLGNNPWNCSTDDMAEVRTWASQHDVDFDQLFHCNEVTAAPYR